MPFAWRTGIVGFDLFGRDAAPVERAITTFVPTAVPAFLVESGQINTLAIRARVVIDALDGIIGWRDVRRDLRRIGHDATICERGSIVNPAHD